MLARYAGTITMKPDAADTALEGVRNSAQPSHTNFSFVEVFDVFSFVLDAARLPLEMWSLLLLGGIE